MPSLLRLVRADLRRKARWCYGSTRRAAVLKALLTDGTAAMLLYRLMQWARRWRLAPLEMLFNKLNAVCCNCVIGRGAEFGPGFVLVHSTGVVINGRGPATRRRPPPGLWLSQRRIPCNSYDAPRHTRSYH
jgi:serine O-acetyltransferase